jgi:hypothetical protein
MAASAIGPICIFMQRCPRGAKIRFCRDEGVFGAVPGLAAVAAVVGGGMAAGLTGRPFWCGSPVTSPDRWVRAQGRPRARSGRAGRGQRGGRGHGDQSGEVAGGGYAGMAQAAGNVAATPRPPAG